MDEDINTMPGEINRAIDKMLQVSGGTDLPPPVRLYGLVMVRLAINEALRVLAEQDAPAVSGCLENLRRQVAAL